MGSHVEVVGGKLNEEKDTDNRYEVSVEGGKYTFFVDKEHQVGCLRYGQKWIDEFPIGNKALFSMIYELCNLKAIKDPVSWLWTILVDNPRSGRQTISFPSLHNSEEGVRAEVESKFESIFIKVIRKDPLCYLHLDKGDISE